MGGPKGPLEKGLRMRVQGMALQQYAAGEAYNTHAISEHQPSKRGTLYCLQDGLWLQCTLNIGQAVLAMLHQGMGLEGCR